jgi:HD superfamily phosphohydrolase
MDRCSVDKFIIFLSKDQDEFKELLLSNNQDFISGIFCALENQDRLILLIKRHHKSDLIIDNLLLLEPLTSTIIDRFIEDEFIDSNDMIKKMDNVEKVASNILKNLNDKKVRIRKEFNQSSVNDNLENVIKEISKHSDILDKKKQELKKQGELDQIKNEIKQIEEELNIHNQQELRSKLNSYKEMKEEFKKIEEEIENSKNIFRDLPQDKA